MASLQAKVQALADTPGDTADMVGRLNRGMAATCPSNRFVTLFFAVLDPRTGELAYSNAGHNPPYLLRTNGEIAPLEGGGRHWASCRHALSGRAREDGTGRRSPAL